MMRPGTIEVTGSNNGPSKKSNIETHNIQMGILTLVISMSILDRSFKGTQINWGIEQRHQQVGYDDPTLDAMINVC
jgi:hypothetical protein